MQHKLTLDLDAITVTTFETYAAPDPNQKGIATETTAVACCGCNNSRNTCSTALC
ncbi:MAG TPA: hypothetical protein VJT67_08165 [Longimicrobiaceae bacterium]|nr:hypothetical protein [Longimicrobiaceae bacterium]